MPIFPTSSRVFIAVLIIVLLFFAIGQFFTSSVFGWITPLTTTIAAPLFEATQALSAVQHTKELQIENKWLQQQLSQTVFDYNELLRLRAENDQLKELLDFSERMEYQMIDVQFIGQETVNATTVYIINKGSRHGIRTGMPVIVENGVLLGRVASVEARYARVAPIRAARMTLSATLPEQGTGVHGVVEARPGVATHMELIPKQVTVHTGEAIVTSGQDIGIPAGLLIGHIGVVDENPDSFFKQATVQFFADPNEYTYVSVIRTVADNENIEFD